MKFNKGKLDFSTDKLNRVPVEKEKKGISKELRKKMFLFGGIVLGIIIVIFVIMFFISALSKSKYTYQEVEQIMVEVAMKYMKDNPNRLPENDVATVNATHLIAGEYMKPFASYLGEDSGCTGYVEVSKNVKGYRYTAYLTCKSGYQTMEFYKKLVDLETVTDGYGLYNINDEFVFRGELVDNYVMLDTELWRIVKVLHNNNVVIVKDDVLTDSETWDNRYNDTKGYRTGINDYKKSRLNELLPTLLTSNKMNLNDSTIGAISTFGMCIGRVPLNYDRKDNSAECSVILENQKIGLLTVSDYMLASVDSKCTKITDRSCQNYNYLKMNNNWWLSTASSEDDSQVFRVINDGTIEVTTASNISSIRPVLQLGSDALYKSGNGTIDNPFTIR